MSEKMLVVITEVKKLRTWPWREPPARVRFLASGRQPLQITIRGEEGFGQAFRRVFGKPVIIQYNPKRHPRKFWKGKGGEVNG